MKIKQNIYLLYIISFLQGMIFYGPVATLYRQAAGVSVFQITIIESISLALCIALEMPWGVAADRIGYKSTMIISCVIYFLSKVVFWKAQGFGGFLLERVMLSFVMAGMSGCDASILYLSCEEGESHKVFGIYQFLNTAGLLGASLLYSMFIGANYRMAGFLTVISYGIAALLAFGIKEVKEQKTEIKKRRDTPRIVYMVIKDWYFLVALAGFALLAETNQTVTVFLNQLQYVKCAISPEVMGYIYILVTLAGMTGMWSAKLTKRMGAFGFLMSMFLGALFACLILAFTKAAVVSVLCIILLRMTSELAAPFRMELENRRVKTSDRATVLSIYAVLMEGTGVFTNILFGRAAKANLSYSMLCGAALCAMGWGFFCLFWFHERKMKQELK